MWKLQRDVAIGLCTAGPAFLGTQISAANGNRELDIRMVEIALSSLKGDNEDAKGHEARSFAIELLKKYSGPSTGLGAVHTCSIIWPPTPRRPTRRSCCLQRSAS
jgi:hypothetical protein